MIVEILILNAAMVIDTTCFLHRVEGD